MEIINIEDDDDLMMNIEDDEDDLIASYSDGGYWRRGRLLGEGSYGAVFMATAKERPPSIYPGYVPECLGVMAVKSAEVCRADTLRLERSVLMHLEGCSSIIQCLGAEITRRKSDGKGIYNLLLEYGSGGTLFDRIENTGSKGLPEFEVRRYTRSLLEGLVRIHDEGFVHCDLKLENILLCPTNRQGEFQAKICDFGLAKRVTEDRQRKKLNRKWNGTPWYLSPEAIKEAVQEPPADIWSLGIMVIEMLTGRPPWDLDEGSGSEAEKVIRQIQKAGPKLPADFSPAAKSFLQSCLRRMAKNRGTAKWLLHHPFISGIRVGQQPDTAMDLTRSCAELSQLNPDRIPKIRIRFE